MSSVPKEWLSYEYHDPEVVLRMMRRLREALSCSKTDDKVRNLRTNKLKKYREGWDAAVFAQLLSLVNGYKIRYCQRESSDYDAILYSRDGENLKFAPLQLKELVPADLNSTASIQWLIDGLVKYGTSDTLIVAIKLNRRERIEFGGVDTSKLKIGGLWCFGATSYDQSKWSIWGDLMIGAQHIHEFDLPYV